VGDRIREARLAHGWSHEELASRVGVNWRTVYRWQNGQLPRWETLKRLADVLGVPAADLIQPEGIETTVDDLVSRVQELADRVDELARSLTREQ
jgi:transcriptional regulator with XRE-family HTH domain